MRASPQALLGAALCMACGGPPSASPITAGPSALTDEEMAARVSEVASTGCEPEPQETARTILALHRAQVTDRHWYDLHLAMLDCAEVLATSVPFAFGALTARFEDESQRLPMTSDGRDPAPILDELEGILDRLEAIGEQEPSWIAGRPPCERGDESCWELLPGRWFLVQEMLHPCRSDLDCPDRMACMPEPGSLAECARPGRIDSP